MANSSPTVSFKWSDELKERMAHYMCQHFTEFKVMATFFRMQYCTFFFLSHIVTVVNESNFFPDLEKDGFSANDARSSLNSL